MPSDFFKKIKNATEGAVGKIEGAIDVAVDKAGDAAQHVADAVDKTVESVFRKAKEVIVYPTYAYRKEGDEGTWVVRLRIWVSKARRLPVPNEVVASFASEMGELSASDVARLRERISAFVADDDSRETLTVRFDKDPSGRAYNLPGETDANGLLMTELELPDVSAQAIRAAQGSVNGWLDFTVAAEGFEGRGRCRLVEPEGVSVISDIDDTIKITEVPAGKHIVLRNTFLRDYKPTQHMPEIYREFGDGVMFHYVSGSPWQLYKLLGEFVRGRLGAIILAQVRTSVAVGLVDQLAVRVGVDRQRAGIDALGNAQFAHQFQHIARPPDVDLFALARIFDANFIPSGDVEHPIDMRHGHAHAFFIGHITLMNRDPQRSQIPGFGRIADHHDHLMARIDQLSRHVSTDETRRPGQKILHGSALHPSSGSRLSSGSAGNRARTRFSSSTVNPPKPRMRITGRDRRVAGDQELSGMIRPSCTRCNSSAR